MEIWEVRVWSEVNTTDGLFKAGEKHTDYMFTSEAEAISFAKQRNCITE